MVHDVTQTGIVVQKYGGSSVADAEKIKLVAKRIARTKAAGKKVVVVVSAMGKTTNQLIEKAKLVSPSPSRRELDMLLTCGEREAMALLTMACAEEGLEAISFTGSQAGIMTNDRHSGARIVEVRPFRIQDELDRGKVVIVAGFQGVSYKREITTLGRGGSDTTAVALAAALSAGACEIYTDVAGVYTADPRVCPQARPLRDIGYEEMLELATTGARVMHARAVEVGAIYNVDILVASTFDPTAPGTLIHRETAMEQGNKVRGIAHQDRIAKVTVRGVPDEPGIAARIFEPLATAGVSVDTIVQNASVENLTDLTFTVAPGDLERALEVVRGLLSQIRAGSVVSAPDLGTVSVVGTGMASTPGYAALMFRTLFDHHINIEMISTSDIRITCVVAGDRVGDAVRALHAAFELDKS
jgi:aspartate kinase